MALTQAQFAERLRVSRNSVARMEVGLQVITPAMGLLIVYVAREAGVEASHGKTGRRSAPGKGAHGGAAFDSRGKGRRAQALPPRRR